MSVHSEKSFIGVIFFVSLLVFLNLILVTIWLLRVMERYFDLANAQLERYFDDYAMQGGNARPVVSIVRYLDDVPQDYCIDFELNQQRNLKTG